MAILAFEHAVNVDNPIKKAIMALGSGGEIVHCEIIFEDFGYLIGSSWNPNGTQIRKLEERNHNKWLYYNIGKQYDPQMFDFIAKRIDKGYTMVGLVTNMIMNLNLSSNNKNFCSQLCFDALKYAGQIQLPKLNSSGVSPNDLHRMILQLGFNQIYL